MQLKHKHQESGFSILEVLIAAVIFAIAVAGLIATIHVRSPATFSEREVVAGFLAKQTLDDLRGKVSADIWSDPGSELSFGKYALTFPGNFTGYTGSYTVSPDPLGTTGRTVTVTITWTEPN